MPPSTAENAARSDDSAKASSPAMNPHVFIVGCPRSGTTMLKRMVDAHPQIAITRETHWVARFYQRRDGLSPDGRVTPAIVDNWFKYHRFAHLGISQARLARMVAKNDGAPYSEFVSKLYDRYGLTQGKPLVGDKTPWYVRKLPTLVELWPHVRIVHLIRDGRDVWLSMRNWRMANRTAGRFSTWKSDPLVTTALTWRALVAVGCQDGAALGARRYQAVYYESLVRESERECRSLASFLDVPFDSRMPRYYEGRTTSAENGTANEVWLPPTPGLRNWRTEMDGNDLEAFEAAAGDLLQRLGYERGHPSIGPAARRRVDLAKAAFTTEARQRCWRLPDDW